MIHFCDSVDEKNYFDETKQKIAVMVGSRPGVAFVGSKKEIENIRHRAWRDHSKVDF